MCESKIGKSQNLENEKSKRVSVLLQALKKTDKNAELVRFLILITNCPPFKTTSSDKYFIERLQDIEVVKRTAGHLIECEDCRKMIEMVAQPISFGRDYHHVGQVFDSGRILVSVMAKFLELPIPKFPPLIQPDYDSLQI